MSQRNQFKTLCDTNGSQFSMGRKDKCVLDPYIAMGLIHQLQIVIDDQLPCYPNGDLMCVSTGSKLQKVPSLIEKAYMALMGGYDFPGSDSCTDLHSSFERERTWRRIVDGYNLGLCVLTLGTGETLSQAADMTSMSLKSAHCYAVVGIHDTESDQAMVVLNSEDHDESTPAHSGEDLELSMTGLRLEERPLQPTASMYWSLHRSHVVLRV
ncbi:hypothetical protein EUX98_g8257 [Antrodiella citrinella]|uniref:Calpain catalytic domain-containing protein n=1 Tax=Antrodiella citrinella TaxID=2447956 RepID=A0A4S4M910_9APHY|nr:hypothetical protein EUX98_g8257 [Antrodiella citrinella]